MLKVLVSMRFIPLRVIICPLRVTEFTWVVLTIVLMQSEKQKSISQMSMVAVIAALPVIKNNMGKNQHVVKTSNGWGIRGENKTRITKNCDTQKEAIKIARQIAINQESELFIHGENGKIRERDSYGNDPCPPKD